MKQRKLPQLPPSKGIRDCLGFWIPRCGYPVLGTAFMIAYQEILVSKVVEFQILTWLLGAYNLRISRMLPIYGHIKAKNNEQAKILTFAIFVSFFVFRVRISRVWLTDKFMINDNCKVCTINSVARIHLIIANCKIFP